MDNNILYLNLSVDDKDVSLGFASTWVKQFTNNFDNVDIITLNKSIKDDQLGNVKVYGISNDEKLSKLKKFLKLKKIIQNLTKSKNYSFCFSHMSPLLLVMTKIYGDNQKFPKVLWYTHPKPKEMSKRLILILSLLICDRIVTASNSSFPYSSRKVKVIGHGIDYDLFFNERKKILNKEFIILSRITKSKNIELAIDGFLNSKFYENSINIIGDSVTKEDIEYKYFLKEKYSEYKNVIFKGKIQHKKLPDILKNYSYHINASSSGYYDKAVLETLSAGIYNFYSNIDYDKHYEKNYIKYSKFKLNKESLTKTLNLAYDLEEEYLLKIIENCQKNIAQESIKNIYSRVVTTD
jgi:hypothetical protein